MFQINNPLLVSEDCHTHFLAEQPVLFEYKSISGRLQTTGRSTKPSPTLLQKNIQKCLAIIDLLHGNLILDIPHFCRFENNKPSGRNGLGLNIITKWLQH